MDFRSLRLSTKNFPKGDLLWNFDSIISVSIKMDSLYATKLQEIVGHYLLYYELILRIQSIQSLFLRPSAIDSEPEKPLCGSLFKINNTFFQELRIKIS